MRICSRAVQFDPYYAQAWALLAIAQSNLRYNFGRQIDDGFAAAHSALSIDPTVGEAHCAMATRLQENGNFEQAEAEIEKALKVAPDSWEVHKEAGRMARLRPGGIARAKVHYERAVEIMDSDFHAWAMLVMCCQSLGETDKVVEGAARMVSEAERALQQDPSNGAALGIIAGGYAILGEKDRAREWIERAMLIDPDNINMKYNFACVLAGYVGDVEEALSLLASVFALSSMHAKIAETDPDLETLHDNPRFKEMLARERQRMPASG